MAITDHRKTLVKHFENFSTTTVIRVFNFIHTSRLRAERFFWLAVLVGFACATMFNVAETIRTFYEEPTVSQVSFVLIGSKGFSFPHAKICLEMKPDSLLELYEEKVEDALSFITNTSDFLANLSLKLKGIHDKEHKRASVFEMQTRNLTLLESAACLVDPFHAFDQSTAAAFTEGELALVGLTTALLSWLVDLEINPTPLLNQTQVSPAVEKLYQTLISKNVDFGALLRVTAEATCVLMQLRLHSRRRQLRSQIRSYRPYNFCKDSPSVFFGDMPSIGEFICYQTVSEPPLLTFSSPDDVATFSMHAEAFYRRLATELKLIMLDIAGTHATEQQPVPHAHFNKGQKISFSVETVSTRLNLRRRGCFEQQTRGSVHFLCELWCRVESIFRDCDCMPLMATLPPKLAEYPSNLRNCALMRYRGDFNQRGRCQKTLSSPYDAKNCSQECHGGNCETMIIQYNYMESLDDNFKLNASTGVDMFMTKFMYETVEEYLTMDLKVFVANLGGNLSLYLGASFLALIHIVVFFIKLPFEAYFLPDLELKENVEKVDREDGARSQSVVRSVAVDKEIETSSAL